MSTGTTPGTLYAVGIRITAARKAAGHTQRSFAEAMGVCRATASFWECGHRDPGVAGLIRIADVLGVSAASLLGGR